MIKPKVLILSSTEDIHATAVSDILNEMKVPVDLFNYADYVEHCRSSFTLSNLDHQCTFKSRGHELDLLSYTAIWHRRPGRVRAGNFFESWISEMVEHEARAALEGIIRSLTCLWVNLPSNDFACTSKLWQLKLAKEIGFKIPDTLVTNEPDEVTRFFRDCNGEIIYKLISDGARFNIPLAEVPNGLPTLAVREEDLPYLSQVSYSPHFFQRYIQKEIELRVTVVGKVVFCNSIDSQSGSSKVDWRNDYSVGMEVYDLPEDIRTKCLQLMTRLGLNYGAIDLIVTTSGDIVFLEINSGGQYLWAETRTGLPISKEMANLLSGKAESLVHTSF